MNIKQVIVFFVGLLLISAASAQTIDSIKRNPNYLWGEGTGRSLQRADRQALKDLTSQISTQVESKYQYVIREQGGEANEFLEGVVNTYSSATLTQAERLVEEQNDGNVLVLRFIPKEQVKKIFENRGNKIKGYVASALDAEAEGRIGDALRYFYWAQCLLISHPDNQEMMYLHRGRDYLLYTWVPDRISRIFSMTQIVPESVGAEGENKEVQIKVLYKDKKAFNLDYSFWTGADWSGLIGSPNGQGEIRLLGKVESAMDQIRLRIEYAYFNKSKMDPELNDVMEVAELPFYPEAEKQIDLSGIGASDKKFVPEAKVEGTAVQEGEKCLGAELAMQKVNAVLQAIKSGAHQDVTSLCTPDALSIYKAIIQYGNARQLSFTDDLKYTCMGDKGILRSVPFVFSFKNNSRQFVENLSFTFNKEGLIENISFALNELSMQGILVQDQWPENSRWRIIDFMENYKTAYALERLSYIESIFADNALIIVGRKLEKAEAIDGMYTSALKQDGYEFIKSTKREYIERLGRIFNSNEFVNIQFEDCTVKKRDRQSEVYGIQIAQNYFSTNYADKGYLFLMVDLKDAEKPKIYVRSWQPEKSPDGSIIGLREFTN